MKSKVCQALPELQVVEARAAAIGATISRGTSSFVVCRWGLCKELASLADVQALLERMAPAAPAAGKEGR